jgi:hypothetical protein
MVTEYLSEIFQYQRQLMERFHTIEVINVYGRSRLPLYVDQAPILDSVEVQLRIKEEMGRIVEEVGEAYDSISDKSKYQEEVADAFHFLVELFLILKVDSSSFDSTADRDPLEHAFALVEETGEDDGHYAEAWMYFISDLMRAANFLKNRPWKATHRVTDYFGFFRQVHFLLYSFARACASTGITREILYEQYKRKAAINRERIASGA